MDGDDTTIKGVSEPLNCRLRNSERMCCLLSPPFFLNKWGHKSKCCLQVVRLEFQIWMIWFTHFFQIYSDCILLTFKDTSIRRDRPCTPKSESTKEPQALQKATEQPPLPQGERERLWADSSAQSKAASKDHTATSLCGTWSTWPTPSPHLALDEREGRCEWGDWSKVT